MVAKRVAVLVHDDEPVVEGRGDYVIPVVHAHVSRVVVEAGFWGGLTGAVVLGVIDPPLGLLLGAGVLVARHRRTR